jgi:hypothetical protein
VANRPAAGSIVGPGFGQVDLPVDQCGPAAGGVGQVDGHLRVLDPACCAGVLALGRQGEITLLEVTSVVQDQHAAQIAKFVAQRVEHVAAHIVTHAVGVPDRLTQQPLHPVRRRVSGLLR